MTNTLSNVFPSLGGGGTSLSTEQTEVLEHWVYDPVSRKLISDRAIETTLNSLYLGEQHKISSGAANIFFTNLGTDTNHYPMWGGLKDQAITANQGASGFIAPQGRVYTDMFNLPLGGEINTASSIGYSGGNYFGVNVSGLGITTVAAETVDSTIRLEYRLSVNGKQVYMQVLPRVAPRSSAGATIYPGDQIEWFFDHPVEITAGTTIFAEIIKVRASDDEDLGIFLVRQGLTPNADGSFRYQTIVHNRLFTDKDLELISPYLKYKAMDFSVDATGASILLRDLALTAGENLLIPHNINTLEAVAEGTDIKIKVKGGAKVIIESLPVNAVSINGSFVSSILNNAVTELNNLFTNTLSFASQGNPVLNVLLSSNYLTVILEDLTSFSVDITTLGVDTNRHVTSGEIVGTDLILTMNDGINPITVDVSNMVNGSTLSATNNEWFFSYGDKANDPVNNATTNVAAGVGANAPFYFGETLTRGSEFKWTQRYVNKQNCMGIWGHTEAPAGTFHSRNPVNWATCFHWNGRAFLASSNSALITANNTASAYTPANGAPLSIRFGSDGHLTLLDLSGGNEVIIAKTLVALGVTEFNMQWGSDQDQVFPNVVITNTDNLWEIVHDYADTEAGILNGILDHTVLKSGISMVPGEKLMFMLDEVGQGDFFGTDYTAASTGVLTAEEQLTNTFVYQTNEALVMTIGGATDWTPNTSANGYFFAANLHQYRNGGGSGTVQGMHSLRYAANNDLELWDEDTQERIATATAQPNGSAIHLYFGVKGNRAYYSIPVVSKQSLGAGSQPVLTFAPDVSNQSFTVDANEAFSLQIALDANSDIVNMYGEVDAPTWAVLNQVSGQFIGTAPAFTGTSDAYVVNCKAANAIGGITNFTVTINVAASGYSNSKSLSFNGTSNFLQGNPINVTAFERATNGDGNAWTISMWMKPSTSTATQTLFVYGAGNDSVGGAITIQQHAGANLIVNYGTLSNKLVVLSLDCLTLGAWNHVVVTFDGGTTGSTQADLSDYYSRFSISVDGVAVSQSGSHSNYGYAGALTGANAGPDMYNLYRIGRASNVWNNYASAVVNQVAIWNSDQSDNTVAIYNGGATQDLSLLSAPPVHYYEIEDSVSNIPDLIGNAPLTGYNFASSDLVTDTP